MADPTDFKIDVKVNVQDFETLTREAVKKFARELEEAERAEIASAGMARYAKRTRVAVFNRGDYGWEVDVIARPNWIRAHEYGARSVGKPMLWVPVYWATGEGYSNRHRRARQFATRLWRPPGTNILINTRTRRVAYIGIPQSSQGAVLNLRQIAEEKANKFVEYLQSYTNA